MGGSALEGNISEVKKCIEHLLYKRFGKVRSVAVAPQMIVLQLEELFMLAIVGGREGELSKMPWESMGYYAKWARCRRSCKQSKAPHCERVSGCCPAQRLAPGLNLNKIQD